MIETKPVGRVLVVDDNAGLCQYLVGLLTEAGFAAAVASSGEEALAVARRESPSAVVLDVCLPGLSGYEVCRTLREEQPEIGVLFISGERVESFDRVAGLLIGADDYLVKPFAPDELLARVRAITRRVGTRQRNGLHGLTTRELEVLSWLANGLNQSEIAARLVISPRTVGTHMEHIFQKLGVSSQAQAVAAAYRERMVNEDGEALRPTA